VTNKIIRTICYFQKDPSEEVFQKLDKLEKLFIEKDHSIQTKRLCSPNVDKIIKLDKIYSPKGYFLAVGNVDNRIDELLQTNNIAFNYDLTVKEINLNDVQILLNVIKTSSAKTFAFTYVFNNPSSSPYFPSATYEKDGFSIGLQSTDLAEDCSSLSIWLEKMKQVWSEVNELIKNDPEFLGIDSSIAPFADGKAKIGEKTDFKNQYLKDVLIKPLQTF